MPADPILPLTAANIQVTISLADLVLLATGADKPRSEGTAPPPTLLEELTSIFGTQREKNVSDDLDADPLYTTDDGEPILGGRPREWVEIPADSWPEIYAVLRVARPDLARSLGTAVRARAEEGRSKSRAKATRRRELRAAAETTDGSGETVAD
jgi:hypothetical protein